MTLPPDFHSASGLRPVGAFVSIAFVMLLVGWRTGRIAFVEEGLQPDNRMTERVPLPSYDIVDAKGRPLAVFVDQLDLVMSPRAMWRAHTPEYMAERIASVLGEDVDPLELLARTLPDAEAGVVTVSPSDLAIDEDAARRLADWILEGRLPGEEAGVRPPFHNMIGLEESNVPGAFTLTWAPAVLLSRAEREHRGFKGPARWTTELLTELATCIAGPRPAARGPERESWDARRDEIWAALMPSRFCVAFEDVPASRVRALREMFEEEGVNGFQMRLDRGLARRYPPREDPYLGGAFEIVGRRGFVDQGSEPVPISGLELLARDMLDDPAWSFLERKTASYTYESHHAARGKALRYFLDSSRASPTPRVWSTLDTQVQRVTRRVLEDTLDEFDAAVAMAIAVDVESGDVITVDSVDRYGLQGFAPTWFTFTPGSTMKVVVMSAALEAGVVRPDERFNTYDGAYHVGGSRVIREAEGAPRGEITATAAIAESCNAVLVQVGLRLADRTLRGKLAALGYGRAPDLGLGGERAGLLPSLPWSRNYTHASICFGHEMAATLWQHAAALATIVRGGVYKPLRIVASVEQDGLFFDPAPPPAPRVFRRDVCETVRHMMHVGAKSGTGEKVAPLDVVVGTKTGTAQKVPGELCTHVELEHNLAHRLDEHGRLVHNHKRCRASMRGRRDHARSCYTSSMCIFGHLPGEEREVLVLVVVEEPRRQAKFGADVAGPAAVAILRESLGLTCAGREIGVACGGALESFAEHR